MPRFHFYVQDGSDCSDAEPLDFPDIEAARKEAVHLTSTLLRDQALGASKIEPLCVEVADEAGNVMVSVAVTLTYRSSPEPKVFGDAVPTTM